MTDPRDNHSVISSLLNSLMSSPKLKKAAGVFVAAFVGAIAVNGFTGNGITNAFRHATQETMKSVKGGARSPAALPGQNRPRPGPQPVFLTRPRTPEPRRFRGRS